ncbi:DNA cytosine methyltransferase [Paenibacillus amylolyticus]|uniref:DNA cytosine methyltransferase n=1 Tax=Paenibacillus amylolyticus TaxID=1451 RepID=UPI0007A0AD4B|nr:DNA cytosine methyltransferase [Paenibacillus amylolyticus]
MRKLSLFSGIGGIDLAAHWAGMETVAFCEREPFPQKVLQKNFPGVPIYDDVCTLTAERLKEDGIIGDGRTIDIISAGFPCQPFSHAGQRGGTDDERYLWPEVVRVVADVRPTWFVGENVAGLLSMAEPTGGTTVESRIAAREADEDFYETIYTQQEIMLIGRICQDLKDIGYEVQVYVFPSASVGSSHKRDRTIIVGNTERGGFGWESRRRSEQEPKNRHLQYDEGLLGDSTSAGFQERRRSDWTESATETGTRMDEESKRPSETLAHSQINTEGRLSIGERTQNTGSACSSEDVAHAACKRCGETRGDQCGGPKERTSGSSSHVADSSSSRQQKFNPTRIAERTGFGTRCIDERGTYRAAQPGVGGNTHEFSNGLDGRGINSLDDLIDLIHEYPQPALMGMPQYDWEPSRVASGIKDRTGRLKALGNAVNPLQIYPIMVAIKAIYDRL